jgi:hypothetical protein
MQPSIQDAFSVDQAPTKTQATTSSTTLDWGAMGEDFAKIMRLFVLLKNTPTSAGAATFTIAWLTSANNSSWTTLKTWTAVALADMTAGKFLVNNEPMPDGVLRYNKLTYTVGGADYSTTGPIVDAMLVPHSMPEGR